VLKQEEGIVSGVFNENVFSPELVLVAGGFDAAQGDPLGGYCLRNSTQPVLHGI
jgi:acetoin utilization deacetylase AcuC-like enzyme